MNLLEEDKSQDKVRIYEDSTNVEKENLFVNSILIKKKIPLKETFSSKQSQNILPNLPKTTKEAYKNEVNRN